MKNSEVASVLYEIADMLEMQNVDFKPAAYRKAARSVEESPEDVGDIFRKSGEDGLRKLPGVGESIAKKIAELLAKGKLGYYEELKKKFPRHISELMDVPGLGPKRIRLLHEKLGISTLKQLEDAVRKRRISRLATFGHKSEEDIARGIEIVKKGRERMLLGYALPAALEMESRLKSLKFVNDASIAGSLRRMKETIGDIDILATSKDAAKVMKFFTGMPDVARILAKGDTKSSVILKGGLQVDLRVVKPESYGAALQYFTGSKEHNVVLRGIAARKGLKVNEYGVFRGSRKIAGRAESEVYRSLGMPFIEPELRENRGEIEAALKHQLPKLIGYGSIKGDFHAHTKHSDGSGSVEEIVAAAKKLGYEYIAITDHSKSERIAHGLSEEKMLEHIKRIREVAKKNKGIRVLAGSEVDIMPDGSLDYSDALLRKFDIVVASVHSRFTSPNEEITSRILAALENPCVDILGHPSGRRMGKREPYNADFGKIFEKASEKKVFLEVNAHPERSDLSDVHVMEAKRLGCKFVIDTDAHSTSGLGYMNLGISTARRAWLSENDVVNTAPAKQLPKSFKRIKNE